MSRRRFMGGAALMAGTAMGAPLARARQAGPAEFVFRGGKVLTMSGNRVADAVAVAGGRIAYVGSDSGAGAHIGAGTEVVELRGRTLMPGIHDGHMHPLSGGVSLTKPTLNYRQLDLKEFVEAIRMLLAHVRPGAGRLAVRRPMGPLRHGSPAHEGGPRSPAYVFRKIPPPTTAQNADALQVAHAEMARQGVTSYMDASAGEPELAALAALADRGPLRVRASAAITVGPELAAEPERMLGRLERLRGAHARPGVTIGTVKMFFDGVIEHPTQTAALLEPYRVNRGTKRNPLWVPGKSRGPTYFRQGVANRAIAALDAAGWQVHVHAIGDRAVRSALDAFEAARRRRPGGDNRHTITHLELVHPSDFRRFKRLGVLASMQLQWAERDSYTVDSLKPYIGPRRWRYTYPAGTLNEAGARLCGGSDWPVDPLLPFRQIEWR